MPEPDHVELQNIINDKEARIGELEEQIKEHESTINTLTQQNQSQAEGIKELEKEIDGIKTQMQRMEKEKTDLEKEVKQLKTWNREKQSQFSRVQQKLINMEQTHANEMSQLKETNHTKLKKLEHKIENLEKKQEDMKSIQSRNKDLEQEKATLQEENNNLSKLHINVPNSSEKCYLCIGQLCSHLQANMYKYVLPDEYSGKGWSYKFSNIKKDINDIEDNDKKQQALARFKVLKTEIEWKDTFEGTINMLQRDRNEVAHPQDITAEAAQDAAQELHKQGKLRGKICYDRVLKIIQMWKKLSS